MQAASIASAQLLETAIGDTLPSQVDMSCQMQQKAITSDIATDDKVRSCRKAAAHGGCDTRWLVGLCSGAGKSDDEDKSS